MNKAYEDVQARFNQVAAEWDNNPTRVALARAVVEAGLGLLELTPVGQSLEEVFVQLTQSQAQAPAPLEARA